MTEGTDLIAELDGLTLTRGPQPITCEWWANASDEQRAAVERNVRRTNFTLVTKKLRALGIPVVADLAARGVPARTLDGVPAIRNYLAESARSGDVIVIMSNGAFGGLPALVAEALGAA